jgi:hypothetical protein
MNTRLSTGDTGTFGSLFLDDGTSYATGELPWRNNAVGQSCVPAGVYQCQIYDSPTHGQVYMLQDVPGRSDVEIHAANWFGDRSLGLKCDMLGCIGLGESQGSLEGQDAILTSGQALLSFMGRQGGQPFTLTIIDQTGAAS